MAMIHDDVQRLIDNAAEAADKLSSTDDRGAAAVASAGVAIAAAIQRLADVVEQQSR